MAKTTQQYIPQPPIKHLVFSGGGAKGTLYIGAIKSLLESGINKNVETVAGSSAGSLVSALLAAGIEAEDLKKMLEGQNFKKLLGKGLIYRDGNPIYQLMSDGIKGSIAKALNNSAVLSSLTDSDLLTKINVIKKKCQDPNGKITFGDLKTLRQLDPEKFKDLKVTAVQKKTGAMDVFDSDSTPDVEVALACRASSSIPVLLKPVEINGKKYVDGGYFDNLPTRHIKDSDKTNSLVFAFSEGRDSKSPLFKALYSKKRTLYTASLKDRFLCNFLLKKIDNIGGNYDHTDTTLRGLQKLQKDFPMRTIELKSSNVSTIDFKKAQKYNQLMQLQGYSDTQSFLMNHDLGRPLNEKQKEDHAYQKFFLEAFKKWERSEKWYSFFTRDPNKSKKAAELLKYADFENYDGKDRSELIKNYIRAAAYDRSNHKLSHKTTAIKTLVKTLNAPDTPSSIKQEFAKAMELPEIFVNNFGRMDGEKEPKFDKDNFVSFLMKQPAAKKQSDKLTQRPKLSHTEKLAQAKLANKGPNQLSYPHS
jgi:NTE family protein